MKKTISEYMTGNDSPFYSDDTRYDKLEVSDFLKKDAFQFGLSQTVLDLFGGYTLRKKYIVVGMDETDVSIIDVRVMDSVMALYQRNKYKYDKLYNTLNLEYNPLDNVDEVDHWTEQHSGKDINTENIGSKQSTEDLGNRSDSMTVGGHSDTNTNKVAPYENDGFRNKEQNTMDYGAHTDSSVIGSQHNNYTEGAQENKDTFEHGHMIEYDRRRHGNIGVTSAMQLITQERQLAYFSLYNIIARDIMECLCTGVLN